MPGEITVKTKTSNREFVNLVPDIPQDKQKEIAVEIHSDYDYDIDSRSAWASKRDRAYKLWTLVRKPKTDPWPGASNVCLPILATAVNQFHGRAYQSIFGAPKILHAFPKAKNDIRRARNVDDYMNWQLRFEMDEYEEVFDKTLLNLPINGTAFKKFHYNRPLDRPESDYISALDLVLPYKATQRQFNSGLVRKAHRLWLTYEELLDRNDRKLYENFDQIPENPGEDGSEESLTTTTDEATGYDKPSKRSIEPHLILECHKIYDLGDGRKPYIFTTHYDTDTLLRVVSRNVETGAETKTLDYFIDYHFIPNSEGFYSFGFGHFLEVLNEMANTCFNQIFDAGRLTNQPFGFYGRHAGFKRKKIELQPGKMFEVDDASQVVFPRLQPLDSVLFNVLGLINDYTARFTSVTDAITGREDPGVERPTARGTQAKIEQGLTTFAVINKRIWRSMRKELKLIKALDEIFLPDTKEFRISGSSEKIAFSDIKREDFGGVQDIIPLSDPMYASKSVMRAEALALYQIVRTDPLIVGIPSQVEGQPPPIEPNKKAMRAVLENLLTTFDIKNMDEILPEIPEQSLSPDEENALYMQGDTKNPLIGEDHMFHLQVHNGFKVSDAYRSMPEDYKRVFEDHISITREIFRIQIQQQQGGVVRYD